MVRGQETGYLPLLFLREKKVLIIIQDNIMFLLLKSLLPQKPREESANKFSVDKVLKYKWNYKHHSKTTWEHHKSWKEFGTS